MFLFYRLEDVKWHIKDGTLYHILPNYQSPNFEIEVTTYDSKTGEKMADTTLVSTPFTNKEIK